MAARLPNRLAVKPHEDVPFLLVADGGFTGRDRRRRNKLRQTSDTRTFRIDLDGLVSNKTYGNEKLTDFAKARLPLVYSWPSYTVVVSGIVAR